MSKLTNAEKDKLDNTCGNLRVTKLGTHVKSLEDFVNEGILKTRANDVSNAINELWDMITNKDCESITIPPPGFFTLFGDDQTGKLYVYYNNADYPPQFRHVETPGELEGTLYLYIADPVGENHYELEVGHYIAVKHLDNYYTKEQVRSMFTVTVEKQTTAESGSFATYVVKQGGSQVGSKINIPKDYLVKSCSVKTCTTANVPVQGYTVGDKYIDWVINTRDGSANNEHLYLLVNEIAEPYKADGSTITLSSGNVFSVKDGGITLVKLAPAVQNLINGKADANHAHGNITKEGKVGTTPNVPLITGSEGVVQAGSFGSGANNFARGNHGHSDLASIAYVDNQIASVEGDVVIDLESKADKDHKHDFVDIRIRAMGENADFNNYKTQGMWHISYTSAQSATNMPQKHRGLLIVRDLMNGNVSQLFQKSNTNSNEMWYRTYYDNGTDATWSTWQKVIFDVDTALSSTSTNPVQNKIINTALSGKANSTHNHSDSDILYDSSVYNGLSPIDMSMIDTSNANRLAFMPVANIQVKVSTNGGDNGTWSDYPSLSDDAKLRMVSRAPDETVNLFSGGSSTAAASANNQIRIILDAGSITSSKNSDIYCSAGKKLMIAFTTNNATGTKVKVEVASYATPTKWEDGGTYSVGGWWGWNSIPFPYTFGGYQGQQSTTDHYRYIRLTFTHTGGSGNPILKAIRLYTPISYISPSNYAKTGHIYTYDTSQNVTFPAKIVKSGGTSSQFLKANGDVDSNTYVRGAIDVPNGTNLNNLNEIGFYRQTSSSQTTNNTNMPETIKRAFTLIVEPFTDGGLIQHLTFWDNSGKIRRYSRSGMGNNWTDWSKYIIEGDSRLTNARTPTSHTHGFADVSIGAMGENVNFDDYKTQGMWHISYTSAQSATNMPQKHRGLLIVRDLMNGSVSQLFQKSNTNSNEMWYRTYYSGGSTWSSWQKMIFDGHTHTNYVEKNGEGSINANQNSFSGTIKWKYIDNWLILYLNNVVVPSSATDYIIVNASTNRLPATTTGSTLYHGLAYFNVTGSATVRVSSTGDIAIKHTAGTRGNIYGSCMIHRPQE